MSISYIPEKIKVRLWGKAGGRCEYEGCNTRLWLDSLTQEEFNAAYIAHIIADQPGGPRGDVRFSEELKSDLTNLMLMCDKHHRLIDRDDIAGHPVERLKAMKALHETRIDALTDIAPDKQSHVILYGANIGSQGSPLSLREAAIGMVPDRFPASQQPLTLGLGNSSFEDRSPEFWKFESAQIRNMVEQQIRPRIKRSEITHLSIFALAPQPLLMLLGAELSDIPFAETYQRRKEPQSWKWEGQPVNFDFLVVPPAQSKTGDAALVFSLSATVTDERVTVVVGSDVPIWRVTIDRPDNDFVRSRVQTESFRKTMRSLLDQIKAAHGERATIHVFPAMPVSLAVDFGRILNAKSDLPLTIYDENKKLGGFVKALEINAAA
jgi:SMODS-associated and fused to various effectors sensor domain